MHPKIIDVSPVDYFAAIKLDESILLDLQLSSDKICMTIDYAGASFDWNEIIPLHSAIRSNPLPYKDLRLLVFSKPSEIVLILDNEVASLDYSTFSVMRKPGPSIVYAVRCYSSSYFYHFECASNKFDLLRFKFISLQSAVIIAEPIRSGTDWIYRSITDGHVIDIHTPFL